MKLNFKYLKLLNCLLIIIILSTNIFWYNSLNNVKKRNASRIIMHCDNLKTYLDGTRDSISQLLKDNNINKFKSNIGKNIGTPQNILDNLWSEIDRLGKSKSAYHVYLYIIDINSYLYEINDNITTQDIERLKSIENKYMKMSRVITNYLTYKDFKNENVEKMFDEFYNVLEKN